MRHNITTILISARTDANLRFPKHKYPVAMRTSCAISFLEGVAAALHIFMRDNEAGAVRDVIAGMQREQNGFAYLEMLTKGERVNNADTSRAS